MFADKIRLRGHRRGLAQAGQLWGRLARFFGVLLLVGTVHAANESRAKLRPFELPEVSRASLKIEPQRGQFTVVCFLGTECPLAKLYAPRLNNLVNEFPSVRFVGINSNRQDSLDDIRSYVKNHQLSFPMLKDYRNQIADAFDAERTPEVFVLDDQFEVCYRGRIDDQYTPGVSKTAPSKEELKQSLQLLLSGKPLLATRTDSVGCFIGRVREPVLDSKVNYCNQISRVLQQHCVECHRQGEIGPFRLDDYEEVVGWADTMMEVIDEGRMPPWHASPEFGDFTNARNMPEADKQLLRDWIAAGLPYGDAKDLPESIPASEAWRLARKPDTIIAMSKREFVVPEDGTVEYQYFVVDPGFEEDRWITGAQIVPGNASVLHHSIVYVRPPDGSRFRGIGWLAAYVPGSRAGALPEGHAIRVPAKSKLVFQQHYTPNGSEQSDLTQLGLTFGEDDQITDEVYTLVGIDQQFEIPPNAGHHVVRNQVHNLPSRTTLRSIMPHMHLRGKAFRLLADQDGATEVLLDVPRYDFNWQHAYQLEQPLSLDTLDRLHFEAVFDNSPANPVNPNPQDYVTWGDQTYEEMAVVFFEVSEPREKIQVTKKVSRHPTEMTPAQQRQIDSQVVRILTRFDENQDGVVELEETPTAFRRYAFRQIDRNGDRKLTREEIAESARRRVK